MSTSSTPDSPTDSWLLIRLLFFVLPFNFLLNESISECIYTKRMTTYDVQMKLAEVIGDMFKWHTFEEPVHCEYHFDLKFELHVRNCIIHLDERPNMLELLRRSFLLPMISQQSKERVIHALHDGVKDLVRTAFHFSITNVLYNFLTERRFLKHDLSDFFKGTHYELAVRELRRFRGGGDVSFERASHVPLYLDCYELEQYYALKIIKQMKVYLFRKRIAVVIALSKQDFPRELVDITLSY